MGIEERLKALDRLALKFNKKSNKTVVGRVGKNKEMEELLKIHFIETPSINLNKAMSGGFAKGRTTIVSGKPDSGKTMLMLETIGKEMQKNPDFIAGWLEAENSLNEKMLEQFNIDPDRFILQKFNNEGAETALDLTEAIISSGSVDMFVINSLKCLTPSEELKKSMGDLQVGLAARLNSKMMRKLTTLIDEKNVALVLIQHLTTQIGTLKKDPLIIAGGNTILHSASMVLDMRKQSISKESDPIGKEDGVKIQVTIKKNHIDQKVFPYVQVVYYALFGEGIDYFIEAIDLAVQQGIIQRTGGWLKLLDENGEPEILEDGTKAQWNGNTKLRQYFIENPSFLETIKNQIEGKVERLSDEEIAEIKQEESEIEKEIENIDDIEDPISASEK